MMRLGPGLICRLASYCLGHAFFCPAMAIAAIGVVVVFQFPDGTAHAQSNQPAEELTSAEQTARRQQRAAQLQTMREFAQAVRISRPGDGSQAEAQMIAQPLFRFNDNARNFADGTIWAWGRSGRPAAVMTVASSKTPRGIDWTREMTSLSTGPLVATLAPRLRWTPQASGIRPKPLPQSPSPANTQSKRLLQMKQLARRFSAFEVWNGDRFELRILPQPIHRYADAEAGILDGSIFVITYGLNPEILLLVELRRSDGRQPTWQHASARISFAELHVLYDGREVWTEPQWGGAVNARYWMANSTRNEE